VLCCAVLCCAVLCCAVLCCAVLYRSLYSSMVGLRPMAFLSFELPPGTFDINVTPDKRSVFMQREVAIVNALGQVRGLEASGLLLPSVQPINAHCVAACSSESILCRQGGSRWVVYIPSRLCPYASCYYACIIEWSLITSLACGVCQPQPPW